MVGNKCEVPSRVYQVGGGRDERLGTVVVRNSEKFHEVGFALFFMECCLFL